MGGECSTYGGEERCVQGFGWGDLRERDHWGDADADGRIIFKKIFKKYGQAMDCIDLALERDTWRALVNEVMNIRSP
jgi:hypothetical protein